MDEESMDEEEDPEEAKGMWPSSQNSWLVEPGRRRRENDHLAKLQTSTSVWTWTLPGFCGWGETFVSELGRWMLG